MQKKLKQYKYYIEILVKNFNDFIDSKDQKKGKALKDTALFFLDKQGVPDELQEVCYLMKKYFDAYFKDPYSYELDILGYRIMGAA